MKEKTNGRKTAGFIDSRVTDEAINAYVNLAIEMAEREAEDDRRPKGTSPRARKRKPKKQ